MRTTLDTEREARERLEAMFRNPDGTGQHFELFSTRGGRHAVSAQDAATIILDCLGLDPWPSEDEDDPL